MVQIPILSGIATAGADFSTAYPVNLIPVPKVQGISEGYLRPADGIVQDGTGPGADRGGIQWGDRLYRVMGEVLVRIGEGGTVTNLGAIPGTEFCTFDYSFDHLAINNGSEAYLYDGTTLARIDDPDFGVSRDVVWLDGRFISTDGEFLVVTELNDPFSVNPLKYGSSEISPDPIVSLRRLRNEVYALNRYTTEIFDTVGGTGFPLQRIEGAQIMKGAVGKRAACEFASAVAFVGGGFNEPPAVWAGSSGGVQKISTREIDDRLAQYSDDELAAVVLETRLGRGHEFLYIHLPDQTLVFDKPASESSGSPVWFVLRSGVAVQSGYRGRGFVWCYGRWNVGDPFSPAFGHLVSETGHHYGEPALWQFATPIVYNGGLGVQVHSLELVAITGNVAPEDDPTICTEYSLDGRRWSQPKYIRAGKQGEFAKRLVWDRQGEFRNWRVQRFTGDTRAHLSFARLEAQMEGLAR